MPARSATVAGVTAAPIEAAWDISVPIDPTQFYPRFGILPGVVDVRDQSGDWQTVGHTRRLMLSDGGHVIETIRQVEPSRFFAYELSDFQKLFGHLVSGARAEWEYSPVAGGGTRIRWTYTFFARRGAGVLVAAIVRALWAPYMRRVLPGILAEVDRRTS